MGISYLPSSEGVDIIPIISFAYCKLHSFKEKHKIPHRDQLQLLIWPIGLFLLKNILYSSGSNSGSKLHIQWSILPHPLVFTSTSDGLYSHIHSLYSHIQRSVLPHPGSILPHPVVYTSTFQQSIHDVIE